MYKLKNFVAIPINYLVLPSRVGKNKFNIVFELPFRHILKHIDSVNIVPKSFSRPLVASWVRTRPCGSVDYLILEVERHMLSNDQQYLLDISKVYLTLLNHKI